MSDVSSIGAVAEAASNAAAVSTQASPSSANKRPDESGKDLPLDSVLKVSKVADAKKAAEQSDGRERLEAAVAEMNDYIQSTQRDLEFSYDEELGETIVKVLDRETEEVIRQIPREIFLKLARALNVDETVQLFRGQA